MVTESEASSSSPTNEPELIAKINRISTIAAAMWMTVVGTLGILFLPLMVGGIIDDLGFSEKQAGYIAAAEMAGVAVASGLGIFWVRRVNWVTIAILSTLAFIAANWASTGVSEYGPMFICRFFVGAASGALLAIGLACQSDSKNADRIFGYWVACQMTVSSAGYLLLPSVRAAWGVDGYFIALVILGFTAFLSLMFFPARGINRKSGRTKQENTFLTGSLALGGALLFFMAQGGLWAFLERLGLAAALSTTQIGIALAISSYLGIVGGLAKNWLAGSLGMLSPFVFVIVGELIMLALFAIGAGSIMFAVAVCLLQFCWAMGMASFLSGLNVIDSSGGLVLLLMSIAKAGYSLGPAMMGWFIVGDDYSGVLIACGVLVVVGMSTALLLIRNRMSVVSP